MAVLPMTYNGLPFVAGSPALPVAAEANCDCCGGAPTLCCGKTEQELQGTTATVTIGNVGGGGCCDDFNGTWICDFIPFSCMWRRDPGPPGSLVLVEVGWDVQTGELSVNFLELGCATADYAKNDPTCAGGSVPFLAASGDCTFPPSVNVTFSF